MPATRKLKSNGYSDSNNTQNYAVTVTDVNEASSTISLVVIATGAYLDANNNDFLEFVEQTALTTQEISTYITDNDVVLHFVQAPTVAINVNGFGADDRIELAIDDPITINLLPSVGYFATLGVTNVHVYVGTAPNSKPYVFHQQSTTPGEYTGFIRRSADNLVTWSNASNPLGNLAGTANDLFGSVTSGAAHSLLNPAGALTSITNGIGLVDFVTQPIPG